MCIIGMVMTNEKMTTTDHYKPRIHRIGIDQQ